MSAITGPTIVNQSSIQNPPVTDNVLREVVNEIATKGGFFISIGAMTGQYFFHVNQISYDSCFTHIKRIKDIALEQGLVVESSPHWAKYYSPIGDDNQITGWNFTLKASKNQS